MPRGADGLGRYHGRGRSPGWSRVTPAASLAFFRRPVVGCAWPGHSLARPSAPETGLDSAPGPVRATTPGKRTPRGRSPLRSRCCPGSRRPGRRRASVLPLVAAGISFNNRVGHRPWERAAPHRSVPAMTPEARRRRLRGRGPVGCRCNPWSHRPERPPGRGPSRRLRETRTPLHPCPSLRDRSARLNGRLAGRSGMSACHPLLAASRLSWPG